MSSDFLKGELFNTVDFEVEEKESEKRSINQPKMCPRCGQPGSGPYERWVTNGRTDKKYEPYFYFAHHKDGKLTWCYLSRKMVQEPLDNKVLEAETP